MTGLYIHIPFCTQKCSYCDFHFSTNTANIQQLIDCLVKEMHLRSPSWKHAQISTIYFGGGTPSLLTPDQLAQLIKQIRIYYSVLAAVEITLECNPENCQIENLKQWKKLGISRLSMGIQSFNDKQLHWMNRAHTYAETIEALRNIHQIGFNELNLDLIYGLPEMENYSFEDDLEQLIALSPDHISAYCLTVETKTALANWVKTKQINVPESEKQAQQFEYLVNRLAKAGYEQYEISNFCKANRYSTHNTAYWKGNPYIGIGPSAHGFDGGKRYWNVANNPLYIKAITNSELPETVETLSKTDLFNECILLGLRTKWGVSKHQLFALKSPDKEWKETFKQLVESALITETDSHFFLTETGKLIADKIASDLFIID
jgi:oxygen-independent coproporphyrinogen-3 oxidase